MAKIRMEECVQMLADLENVFQTTDWIQDENIEILLAVLKVVDEASQRNFSGAEVSLYHENIEEFFMVLKNTAWNMISDCEREDIRKLCLTMIVLLKEQLVRGLDRKKKIVFLPYKASMWDSLESVWRAAYEDKEYCDTYVVPIPYADRNSDFSAREWHCEADSFPKDVPVLDYREYTIDKLKEMQPDAIFIHNPYDGYNRVTSVEGSYYSDRLKECTKKLIYIPYYVSGDKMMDGLATTPGVIHADYVIAQDENIKRQFEKCYPGEVPEGKFLALGSPKFDRILGKTVDDFEMPLEWKQKIVGKKVVLYNTGIKAALEHPNQICDRMRYVFSVFKSRKDIVLWWRPHPLLKATFNSMIEEFSADYRALEREFIEDGYGIYDDTADVSRAIVCTDAYYGDPSSLVNLYKKTGKPIMLQSVCF